MKMMERFRQLMLTAAMLLPMLAFGLVACDSEEENDIGDGKAPFESLPVTSTVTAKDFKMSDIDALVEMSLKMEGLRVQYAKMMSNGWKNELYSGPGEYTDGSKFYDYVADLLDNAEQYQAALERLEKDGILKKTTVTRGIMLDFANWCYSLNAPKEVAYERMLTILNKNKVTGNMAAMQALFNSVPEKHKCGMTDAKQWFVNLYAGEYKNKGMSIHDAWLTVGAGEGNGPLAQYFDTYAELYDKGPGNPRWKDSHEVIKDVAEKGGTFYVSCVDEVTGGYVGKMVDINDISQETINLAKKIREGKATTSDLKKFAANLGSKYVKDKAGDLIGEDPGGLERLAGEITDYVTTHAIEAADEEIAEELGVNLYEIQKNTPQGTLVTIIEDVKEGNLTIGFPGKDGNTHIVTKPGEKNITVVTTSGERITQEMPEKKPGKVEVEAQPQEKKATVKLSPDKVNIVATGGKTTVEILSNCPYARFRFNGEEPDWLSVSRKGKTLTLDAKANISEQPRTVTFRVDVSFEGKEADANAIITVTQAGFKEEDDRPMIEVDKTELVFDANGGEQTVKLDVKTYQYYGGITDDNCEDWVTVKSNGSAVSLTVTVAPNKTDQERTGTIYAFATNKEKVETEKDYVLLPITVKQAAGSQQQESGTYVLKAGEIYFQAVNCYDSSGGKNKVYGTFYLKNDTTISGYSEDEYYYHTMNVTENGRGVHVEAECVHTYYWGKNAKQSEWTQSVKFDIDDMSRLDDGTATISGFSYRKIEYEDNYAGPGHADSYMNSDRAFTTSDILNMEAPIKYYPQIYIYSAKWSKTGTELSGSSYYTYKRTYYESNWDPEEFIWGEGFISDSSNKVTFTLDFTKANVAKASRSGRSMLERVQQTAITPLKDMPQ